MPSIAAADLEAVRTGYGSLILGGVFQAGFNYYVGDEILGVTENSDGTVTRYAVDRPSVAEFVIGYARLNFKGTIVDDRVRYFVQLELNPQDEEATGPRLLDGKIGLSYLPYTTFWLGRFAPDFTFFNPVSVARLGLIDYPLMNQFLTVQRQTGADVSIDHTFFELDIGVTNGLNFDTYAALLNPADRNEQGLGNDGFGDENTMKDVFGSIAFKPVDGLRIWGGYWWGNPLDYFEEKSDGEIKPHHVKTQLFNAGLAYFARFGLTIMGEFYYSKLKYDNDSVTGVERDDDFLELKSMSWYGRIGFNMKESVGVPLELIGQYDWLDPDTENDADIHGENDELMHITGGLNYYIKSWHAMVAFNYIYKDEDWKIGQKDGVGSQTGLDNDELKFQAQVAF
jgi:hypothetical protein